MSLKSATPSSFYVSCTGPNYVTILSPYPFSITAYLAMLKASPPSSEDDGREEKKAGDVEAPMMVLPIFSTVLPREDVSRYGPEIATIFAGITAGKKAKGEVGDATESCHVAAIWCLQCFTAYRISLCAAGERGAGDGDQQKRTECVETMTVTTRANPTWLQLRGVAQCDTIFDGDVMRRPDFLHCARTLAKSKFILFVTPEPTTLKAILPYAALCYYDGLFTLPMELPVSDTRSFWLYSLPNGPRRFILDLRPEAVDAWSFPQGQGVVNSMKTSAEATADVATSPRLFPWRRNRKVQRAITSHEFAVVVRSTSAEIEASLNRAAKYHVKENKGTWLYREFRSVLAQFAATRNNYNVKLLNVEVVNAKTGEVAAGCCGMAVGSVYHDYTMYTTTRVQASLGTLLTKLVGEALQKCGYRMWYWGFRIGYMELFEHDYGGRELDVAEFFDLWEAGRDVQPAVPVDIFILEGKSMLPYYSGA